ncbi:MAG: TonB-dependent receptor [endosymbiont of Galathealinum brachiosum]|uniref:TonB-dependent receptor n=1 Tax=endosymbiont of Galathealinum brachiosum TaxID=2200906 RepID=A0A370DL80_9GAMM|nr:MAG: TonB-dependent receptor [endosymbiont of Galathealinum brachiosum]
MNKHVSIISFLTLIIISNQAVSRDKPINEIKDLYDQPLETLMDTETELKVNIGTRDKQRDVYQSMVPIDVITAEQMNKTGYTELSKVLQRLLPSFNFPLPSITDGTDHVRPFTLRGMAADQVLVLINGKRMHASTLLNVNGSIGRGSSGVDLNTIPLRSINRIEILKDGAAAQYGSDAIAGIINVILKSDTDINEISSTLGTTDEGDGRLKQIDLHYAIPLAFDGFINFTIEARDRGETNRSGVDARQQYFTGDPRNDADPTVTTHYGDADTQDLLLSMNSEIAGPGDVSYYAFALFDYRESEASAFFRPSQDNRNVRNIYPDGFLPHISPEILDASITLGIKDETNSDFRWDVSYNAGVSDYTFQVNNSLNTSIGLSSPTTFDSGSTQSTLQILNLDLFNKFNRNMKDSINIASGLEIRHETYKISAGEQASWVHGGSTVLDGPNTGDNVSAGAQGFPGFRPENEVDQSRNNYAAYIDFSGQVNEKWSAGAALRYDYYSDFGSTINGKLSAAYKANGDLMLRSSASSGFRAPSLQQSFYTSSATITVNDNLTEIGTFSVNHPLAKSLGATDLEAEKSNHLSLGAIYQPSNRLSVSSDFFYTEIDDRVVLSGEISQDPGESSAEVIAILQAAGVEAARYFSNAVDTKTYGFDIEINYTPEIIWGSKIKLSALYHQNKTQITGDVKTPDILKPDGDEVIFATDQRDDLESSQPRQNFILTGDMSKKQYHFLLKFIRAGEFKDDVQTFSAQWMTDLELSYQLTKISAISIGGHNIFDSVPDTIDNDTSPIFGDNSIIPYSQFSPYGFNGAFFYLRFNVEF